MGRATDKSRGATLSILVFVLAGGAAALLAATSSYWALLLAGAVAGVAMALMQLVSNLLLLDFAQARTRGILVAIKHTGIKLGQAFSGLMPAPIAAMYGASMALVIPVGLAVAGAITTQRALPGTAVHAKDIEAHPARGQVPASLYRVAMYSALMGCSQSAVGAYIALFAFEEIGLSRATAGMLAGLLG